MKEQACLGLWGIVCSGKRCGLSVYYERKELTAVRHR